MARNVARRIDIRLHLQILTQALFDLSTMPKPSKFNAQPMRFPQRERLWGFALIAFSAFSLLSLVTYTPAQLHLNWLGLLGHCTAWLLRYLFGLCAYPLTFIGALRGWQLAVNSQALRKPWYPFSLLLLASCGLALSVANDGAPNLVQKCAPWTALSPNGKSKVYLGGAPLQVLYRELPLLNLHYLLSPRGTLICALLGASLSIAMLSWPWRWVGVCARAIATRLAQRVRKTTKDAFEEAIDLPQGSVKGPTTSHSQPLELITLGARDKKPRAKPSAPSEGSLLLAPQESTARGKSEQAHFSLPEKDLLTTAPHRSQGKLEEQIKHQAGVLEETLLSFGIEAKVGRVHFGPTIVSFEVHPAIGVKVQRIKALESDIALNMQARSIRIIAPIPGKAAVGVEVPAKVPQEVGFKELLAEYLATENRPEIPLLLGKSVAGEPVIGDLTKMPHLIIAGATGSGKSVCINTIVMSLLMSATPQEIRLLMIDPKKVELTAYSELPHMIAPVITEASGACEALNWLVKEMERRYEILRRLGLRNIGAFNARQIDEATEKDTGLEIPPRFPYIVGIVDELADLMMSSSSDIETPITRIAQMARAVGIHLILATQRPSREVITGLIKANFPARIAFKVANRVNSQIILDEVGAETLLGNGDMLFLPPGTAAAIRAQGAYMRDEDINRVVRHICRQAPPDYLIASFDRIAQDLSWHERDKPTDPLFDQALQIVTDSGLASTTFLQRKLKIGYARAASLVDLLEARGVISGQEGSKPRRVLIASSEPPGARSSSERTMQSRPNQGE